MRRKSCEIAVLVTGLLIFIGGFAHSLLGWPAVAAGLTGASVDRSLMGGLFMEWNFAAGAMLVMGAVVILLYGDMRRSASASLRNGLLVGALYALFGVAGTIRRFPNPHFLVFLAVGGILTAALLLWRKAARGRNPSSN